MEKAGRFYDTRNWILCHNAGAEGGVLMPLIQNEANKLSLSLLTTKHAGSKGTKNLKGTKVVWSSKATSTVLKIPPKSGYIPNQINSVHIPHAW